MAAAALRLDDLRAMLDARFPEATPVPYRSADTVATGVEALDAILPSGGLPRGRLSVWAPRGGATAMLRAAALTTARVGERVIWIDGAGTVAGAWWPDELILVRPESRVHALRAAEHVLRAGGFALVVLTGAQPEGTESVRLARAAQEGGSAFVAIAENAAMAGVKLSSRIASDAYRWVRDPHGDPALATATTLEVRVTSLGWNRRARVALPIESQAMPQALSVLLPDRRGVPERVLRRAARDGDPFMPFTEMPGEPVSMPNDEATIVVSLPSRIGKPRAGFARVLGMR